MAHQITISWQASPGPVSGYNVRRGSLRGNESSTPINSSLVTGTSYTDNSVLPGQSYSYAVSAVNSGVESVESIDIESAPVPFGASPAPLALGAAESFLVLGASTVTNTGATSVSGDVGVSPGSSMTGFSSPSAISGVFHPGDFVSAAAQTAHGIALDAGMALAGGTTVGAELGGSILDPGVYKNASSVAITGALILNAHGDPNACWIFQIGSTLTTAASNSYVICVEGAQASNVFWLVGSSATLNSGTFFAGNILAQASITVDTGVIVEGRLLARTGAVTLDGNDIIMFSPSKLAVYGLNQNFALGQMVFDGVNYQQASTAGLSGAHGPAWSAVAGGMTQDGTAQWTMVPGALGASVLMPLPASKPNTPPSPPAAPLGLQVTSES